MIKKRWKRLITYWGDGDRWVDQGGYATVEFALTIPAVIAVVALGMGSFAAGAAKVQTCAQARSAARATAIGQPYSNTAGLSVQVKQDGDWVVAQSSTTLGGRNSWVPQIRCQVTTVKEPDYGAFY